MENASTMSLKAHARALPVRRSAALCACAAVTALGAGCGSTAGPAASAAGAKPPGRSPVPAPSGPPATSVAPVLLEHYAVLRAPRRPGDALGRHAPGRRHLPGDANQQFSRLVATLGGVRLWLVPGQVTVCTVESLSQRGGGGAGCGRADQPGYATGHAPAGSVVVGPWRWRPHRRIVFLVLPDGTTDVRLEKDGRLMRRLAIQRNGVIARAHDATAVSWRAPDGTRHRMTIR
jgi:hypothetical protein